MFDYKSFAQNMVNQSKNLIPAEFSQDEKDYISSTIGHFVELSGESLNKNFDEQIDDEQKVFMTQVLAEWTFHKAADVIRSGIPRKNWDSVMQKIAYTVFEVTKEGLLKGLPQEQLLDAVEHHVKKCYAKIIDDLCKKNIITDEIKEKAQNQSNIDKMSKECQEKNNENPDRKNNTKTILHVLKLLSIGFVSVLLVIIILTYLDSVVSRTIIKSVLLLSVFLYYAIEHLKKRNKTKKLEKELEDIRKQFQELIDPENMYKKLGVDVIMIQVGQGLLEIADPDAGGLLMPKITAMRHRLTEEYGFVTPNVRVMDNNNLNEHEYQIFIRGNSVANGFVYPDRYMVIADQWDSTGEELPEDSIIGVSPIYDPIFDIRPLYQSQVYWINPEEAKSVENIIKTEAVDIIIKHLEEELFKNADEILTVTDIKKLITLVESQDPLMVKGLLEKIDYHAIREVLANLLREKISIKDITLIFSRLTYFVQYTTFTDELSEKLRQVLSNQICKRNCDEGSVIYALDLSENITKELLKNLHPQIGLDKTSITLDEEYEHNLVENIAAKLMNIHQEIGSQPILICDEKIRLGLYRLLVRYIQTITVLSKQETSDAMQIVKTEIVDTIEFA